MPNLASKRGGYNKPKAVVHPERKLTGPKKKKKGVGNERSTFFLARSCLTVVGL